MSLKTIIVMPAFNAAATLERTYNDIPPSLVDEIILVDDASSDRTVEIAQKLGLTVIVHPENRGYGANQKTCYDEALKRNPDIVVMIHPDYQYDSSLIPYVIGFLEKDICDVILGSRIRTRKEALACGMPKYVAVYLSWAMVVPPLLLIARQPSAPSFPVPDKITPITSDPKARDADLKRTSAEGRT